MSRRGAGVEYIIAKAETNKQDDTLVEFRVAMTSTCMHKEPIYHYKAKTDVC